MGIPSYFSFVVKNHRHIIKRLSQLGKVHNFYLDSNSIIYDSLRELDGSYIVGEDGPFELSLIELVCSKMDVYIGIVKPTSTVYIAFDGVAPVAKLEQQRNRRYKSRLVERLKASFSGENPEPEVWDRTAITPGTNFMHKLGTAISSYYSGQCARLGVKRIIVSTSAEAGEGEHKLFAYLRNNAMRHRGEVTLVYGLDADLIMLCLNHLPVAPRIYLYRETPEFIKSIDASLEPSSDYYLDIPVLAKAIIGKLSSYRKTSKEQERNLLHDYIFLCFLMGNDFLPHFPALNIRTGAIHQVIAAYQNTVGKRPGNLTDGYHIQWGNLKYLITYLAAQEKRNLLEQYAIRKRWAKRNYPARSIEDKLARLDRIPTKEREIEHFIEPSKVAWEHRYYKALFGNERSPKFTKKISTNYLEGLEWVMHYYTKGCTDWYWCYHYHYPPLLSDLQHYIPNWETQMVPRNPAPPLPPLVQLAYVLPYASLGLLPPYLSRKLLEQMGACYGMDFPICWAFCKYLWEGHVVLPAISIPKLLRLVETL